MIKIVQKQERIVKLMGGKITTEAPEKLCTQSNRNGGILRDLIYGRVIKMIKKNMSQLLPSSTNIILDPHPKSTHQHYILDEENPVKSRLSKK